MIVKTLQDQLATQATAMQTAEARFGALQGELASTKRQQQQQLQALSGAMPAAGPTFFDLTTSSVDLTLEPKIEIAAFPTTPVEASQGGEGERATTLEEVMEEQRLAAKGGGKGRDLMKGKGLDVLQGSSI